MAIYVKLKSYINNFFISTQVKNVMSFAVIVLFVLIIWIVMSDIDNREIDAEQIPNYDNLIINPNERVEEFKKGIVITDIISRKEFIELRNEDNLIKEGKKIKEGNLFIKKF